MTSIRIAIGPFPGSPEDCFAQKDRDHRGCGSIGCPEQVTFWCETSGEWVCYRHGHLLLKQEWGLLDQHHLIVEGPIRVDTRRTDHLPGDSE